MQNQPANDVNLNVVGTGCATSCATGCISIVVLLVIAFAIGVRAAGQSVAMQFLGFAVGMLSEAVVGYYTARRARELGAAVNLHIFVVGTLLMVFALLSFVIPNQGATLLSAQTKSVNQMFSLLSWVLTLPAMFVGARWNSEETS